MTSLNLTVSRDRQQHQQHQPALRSERQETKQEHTRHENKMKDGKSTIVQLTVTKSILLSGPYMKGLSLGRCLLLCLLTVPTGLLLSIAIDWTDSFNLYKNKKKTIFNHFKLRSKKIRHLESGKTHKQIIFSGCFTIGKMGLFFRSNASCCYT